MRGENGSRRGGGSSACPDFTSGTLPPFGPPLSVSGPIRRGELQISNRDTKRLETPATQTKQTIGHSSNRDKNVLFQAVFRQKLP